MTVNRLSGNRVLIILDGDDMRTLSLDIERSQISAAPPAGAAVSAPRAGA